MDKLKIFVTVLMIVITAEVLSLIIYAVVTKQNFVLYKSLCAVFEWFIALCIYLVTTERM